jgi:hypothetical protein
MVAGQSPSVSNSDESARPSVTMEMRPATAVKPSLGKLTVTGPATATESPRRESSSNQMPAAEPRPSMVVRDSNSQSSSVQPEPKAVIENKISAPRMETPEAANLAKASPPSLTPMPQVVRIPSMTLVAQNAEPPSLMPSAPRLPSSPSQPSAPAALSTPAITSADSRSVEVSLPVNKAELPELSVPSLVAESKNAETRPTVLAESLPQRSSTRTSTTVVDPRSNERSNVTQTTTPDLNIPKIASDASTTKVAQLAAPPTPTTAERSPTIVALPASQTRESGVIHRSLNDENLDSSFNLQVASQATPDEPMLPRDLPTARDIKPLEVIYRSVQTIELGRSLKNIEVEDESVCKAIITDATSVLVLGLNKGTSKLTIWSNSPESGFAEGQTYEVTVRDAWSPVAGDRRNVTTIEEAQLSLAEIFPSANVNLKSLSNGSLAVFGKADSNDQAKQIVQLVRKMFLVPVIDRIAVTTP